MSRKDMKGCPERMRNGVQEGLEKVARKDWKRCPGGTGKGVQEGWEKVSRKDGKRCPERMRIVNKR